MQTSFDRTKSLARQKPPICRNDPYKLPVGLKSNNFVWIQQEVLSANAADQLLGGNQRSGRVYDWGNLGEIAGYLKRLSDQSLRSFNSFLQSVVPHGLQQAIDRTGLESLNGVLIKRRDNYDDRKRYPAQVSDYFKATHDRHLQIKENEVGPDVQNLLQRIDAVLSLSYHLYFWNELKVFPQNPSRDSLIIHDQRSDG